MGNLTKKSYKKYDRLSRYSVVPYYYNENDGKYVYATTENLRTDTPYVLHTIKNGETFDSIALYYYNNPTYYWIICDYNRIQDPFRKLKEGEKIKVPTLSSIAFKD